MKNDPLLYINSVGIHNEGDENQTSFDSRKTKRRNLIAHRLEDIKAMISNNMTAFCEIKTNNTHFEGVIYEVNENFIKVKIKQEIILVNITNIDSINIL